MKILLDENLPVQLSLNLKHGFIVKTVKDMNWLGKKNGELLSLIEQNNFTVFITLDKNLPFQQHLDRFNFSIFILKAVDNRLPTLLGLMKIAQDKIIRDDFTKLTIIENKK